MHPSHLKRAIKRTQKQIKRQKGKQLHSVELSDKIAASDELRRLRLKLGELQRISNGD